jgi:hypothetical protein
VTGRGLRGRRIATRIVVASSTAVLIVFGLLATPPSTMGPTVSAFDQPLVWLGLVGCVAGIVWMVRIVRATPESRHSSWRFASR